MVSQTVMSSGLKRKICELERLLQEASSCRDEEERQLFISKLPQVKEFLQKNRWLHNTLGKWPPDAAIAIKSVIAIGEGKTVFSHFDEKSAALPPFRHLVDTFVEMERFYDTIGGIIGYHLYVIRLIDEGNSPSDGEEGVRYYKPPGVNIMEVYGAVDSAVKQAVENMPLLGELYPVGGAGDRLNLLDKKNGDSLPAALLPFCGKGLLTLLVRDVQAKEYLYFKLMGKQLTIPLALMTSQEKENHAYILDICEKERWFGRPKESFRFFIQPLVPVVSEEGSWIMRDKKSLWLKPGGHGVIWKKALDDGVIDWFKSCGKKKLLVRQINNPLAGTDYGILAFLGIGFQGDKSFGFASCRRVMRAAEGMNVLIEKKVKEGYSYAISNIEYTEFAKRGIDELPLEEGSRYSAFPANTNILFADIGAVERALEKCPIPGIIINMKSSFDHFTPEGKWVTVNGGRLESTMQNIADAITDTFAERLNPDKELSLKTYATYNKRRKTLSVTKSGYQPGQNIEGSPQGGYYDLLQNTHELFQEQCAISLPKLSTREEYMEKGPCFHALYHPALGPCWTIIKQKISGGSIAEGAELQLELSELHCKNLSLKGSLLIEAKDPLGRRDSSGALLYGNDSGKCELLDVTVENEGIDRKAANNYWSNDIRRKESLKIILHGNGEFFASNVTFRGDLLIEVPDGYRVEAKEVGGAISFDKRKINAPTWHWDYTFDERGAISLSKL